MLLRLAIACYSAPSRLALDAHDSPRKAPFATLRGIEVGEFLTDLAVQRKVSASTQNQALNAVVFLYHEVLGQELGEIGNFQMAKRPIRQPLVLTRKEVQKVLSHLQGEKKLMSGLLYGAGIRISTWLLSLLSVII
ncbi:MAG: hypothetical protein BA872_09170 [Desulfobacterales bacterium C00003060]|nr:MAG: hypothetical protein BA861_06520 [Desulfobacterales bacterium S3730MH5]OEU78738.1 MAG: hypothetical protein BA865_05630 [Desulfobacterales bacterium S5133MH4]OEU80057.1 MAG: hypothetical protein BA872_09170 [Desulfobacterales bacterium C00003060]